MEEKRLEITVIMEEGGKILVKPGEGVSILQAVGMLETAKNLIMMQWRRRTGDEVVKE